MYYNGITLVNLQMVVAVERELGLKAEQGQECSAEQVVVPLCVSFSPLKEF